MNKIFTALVALTSLGLIHPATNAQEYQGCFMIDSSGKVIELNNLCPDEQTQPTTGAIDAGVYQIPIKRREGGIPVVDVVFNGDHRFEMLFDTGASSTLITPTMAQKLNVVPFDNARIATASSSAVDVPVGRVNSLQVGDAVLQQAIVTIAPAEVETGLRGMGLLGQNFFGDYDVTIKEQIIELRVRN